MSDILDRLEALAKAATPGPWGGSAYGDIMPDGAGYLVASCIGNSGPYRNCKPNAAHIAACDPSTILRLVRVARAAGWLQSHLDHIACLTREEEPLMDELRAALAELTGDTE
jgi:hypothetical protein